MVASRTVQKFLYLNLEALKKVSVLRPEQLSLE